VSRARGHRLLAGCAIAIALVTAAAPPVEAGDPARPRITIRPAGDDRFAAVASAEQQRKLGVTFFVRIRNVGAAAGSFVVDGDHGGDAFAVRYLSGGSGDGRITEPVVRGTYRLEDVPPGATRTLRMRVAVRDGAPIDRSATWRLRVSSPADADGVRATVRTVTAAFARAAGVTLRVPAADVRGITFHESLFGTAVALRPIGRLVQNDNPAFDPPPNTTGPGYIVMDSRDRGTPPTSGSDDVLSRTEAVLAPVTGTVVRVTSYPLYCEWRDVRIAIRPKDAPTRIVQIFHVLHPSVRRGDHVRVSHTVIGRARLFPFRSQTQDYGLGARHVHIEIERDGSTPLPGCGVASASMRFADA
jgi:hypothetical protein